MARKCGRRCIPRRFPRKFVGIGSRRKNRVESIIWCAYDDDEAVIPPSYGIVPALGVVQLPRSARLRRVRLGKGVEGPGSVEFVVEYADEVEPSLF